MRYGAIALGSHPSCRDRSPLLLKATPPRRRDRVNAQRPRGRAGWHAGTRYPIDARTMATIPARTAAGSRPHAATTSARSGGTALHFTLVLCSPPRFSRVKPGSFESCPRHSLHARPAILARAGCFFWGRMAPAGFFCAASCRGTPIPEEPAAARLVAAGSVVSCGSLQIPAVTCGVGFRVATASDFKSVLSRLNCGRTGAPDPPSASSKWWSRHIRAC